MIKMSMQSNCNNKNVTNVNLSRGTSLKNYLNNYCLKFKDATTKISCFFEKLALFDLISLGRREKNETAKQETCTKYSR